MPNKLHTDEVQLAIQSDQLSPSCHRKQCR